MNNESENERSKMFGSRAIAIGFLLEGRLVEAEINYRESIQYENIYKRTFLLLDKVSSLKLESINPLEISSLTSTLKLFSPEEISDLGILFQRKNKLGAAIILYKIALILNPQFPEALSNLGNALQDLEEINLAINSYKAALLLQPDFPEAFSNIGHSFQMKRDFKKAILSYQKAIKLRPDFPEALYNLANAYQDLGDLELAERNYICAIKNRSNYISPRLNLGLIKQEQKKYLEAIKQFENVLSIDQSIPLAKAAILECYANICDWDSIDKQLGWLAELGIKDDPVAPLIFLALEDQPRKSLTRAQRFFSHRFFKSKYFRPCAQGRKLRIGYFSGNFFEHPVMHLMIRIFELHDDSEFEIYAYAYGPRIEDRYTDRVRNNVSVFRDIRHLTDKAAAELSQSDQIDIAVDLMGYTQHARTAIFANRAAPIQINYLGYPGSMGSDCFDYILADKVLIPSGSEEFYSEKVLYMPHCYQCNDDTKNISRREFTRRELGLPEDSFVFTCFNATYKITRREFDIWMRLLSKVDKSVLWLLKSNPLVDENLHRHAKLKGICPSRIVFAEKLPLEQHLARHKCGDLFLDTFNYNAHTTGSDALWAGMPLLTKAGKSFSARVGASLLNALNLVELITSNEQEYEKKAYEIATNPTIFSSIKTKLMKNLESEPLFNSKKYTTDLESLFKSICN